MVWQKEDRFAYENFIEKHKVILVFFILLFICLSIRLFYLQIIKGNKYKAISEQQRLHNTNERAPRGIIYSSDNDVLVSNEFFYVALYYPPDGHKEISDETLKDLEIILGRDIKPKTDKNNKYGKVLKLADNLTKEEMFKVREQNMRLRGVSVAREPRRVYPLAEASCHVTGYTSEIKPEEIEDLSEQGYKPGDYIGRGGIEQAYDEYLQGKTGGWQVEVNARGYRVKASKYIPPEIGASIYSTINSKLQKVAYDALKNSDTGKGAAVVLDAKTGAVLSLVSCPGFDTNKIRHKEFSKFLKDKNLPLFNRALQALYPPGSIFKVVTFAAAVEVLNISPSEKVLCTGKFELGDRHYTCWYKPGHGWLDLIHATAQSCNIYFYQLGLKLGVKNLEKFSKKFYLGRKTGVDLPNEKSGFVPNPEWKKSKQKMKWLQGDTVIFSIGQGGLWITPLQMAHMMSSIANKGVCNKPYAVEKIIDVNGEELYRHKPEKEERIDLSDLTWSLLHTALLETIESGTGKRCKFKYIKVAGKTGTAQNPHGKDHAWFISYAPADNPEIVIAVIVEHGGGGGVNSVPIGRKIYEAYFNIGSETEDNKESAI
ncbi:penicillin-binding protein 2 [Candidatus Endomicrobiellum devescovinae]|jgi:penicillin-binding protein 2|uniref:penicillin-binding protein 2 n=1 Tax=Candidatus Endomicrobiellum devescovinae TaxID=3242322 RepID=UPI0028281401|nr:penicillin-binding protein 2 [Endomicrobium sp.]